MEVLYLNTHLPTGMSLLLGQVGRGYSEILELASPPLAASQGSSPANPASADALCHAIFNIK